MSSTLLRPVPCSECAGTGGHAAECSADTRMVTYTVQSNVFVESSVQVPESHMFGFGSTTEAVECGQCYALVTKEREYGHSLWHKDRDGTAGQ